MRLILLGLAVLGLTSVAQAQTPGIPSSGPLVLEPIETHFVVAPEYKITDLDGRTGQMAGVSAGVLTDESLYIGGAVYSLTNRSDDFRMTYGGLLVGWTVPFGSHLRIGGRGLVGLGSAALGDDVTVHDRRSLAVRTVQFVQHDDFVFVEPQGQAHIGINNHLGLDVSAGYRFAGLEEGLHDRLDGATGAIAMQIGW